MKARFKGRVHRQLHQEPYVLPRPISPELTGPGGGHVAGAAPLPVTVRVVVLTAWPSVFSATALYWPLSLGETLGMTKEHTPSVSVLYTPGFPARLWSSLNQVTWGWGQPRTAQLMQHSQPDGSMCGRRPTRNQGFWRRLGSR